MAENSQSSDPPSISPKFVSPVKTLDESSPTAPIRALVAYSLSLSSPIRQIQSHDSPPAKPLTQIQNPDVSSPPSDKTLIPASSSIDVEENESEIIPQAEISPDDNNNNLQIVTTSYSFDANRDSCNRPPRRRYVDDNHSDDDDLKIESKKPEEFSWYSRKIEPTGVGAGLRNSGNTCFIASVLQCLTHCVPLIESLRSYQCPTPCNCGNDMFCVMQALREHIELALRNSGDDLTVYGFRDNLKYFSPDFQINHQEDAHEFMQSFLDKLERCCLDRRNKLESTSSQDVNVVDNVFGGRLLSRLHCCNCNAFSDIFEPSVGCSLEIEDVDNLLSALESFTRVEKLEDQFTCDNCKEKVSKEKQLKFDKLPMVATFHLKRFKNNGVYMEKIFKQVQFPLELDLSPYMSGNQDPEVSTKYRLYAFVEHLGNGVSFGHYSSYVRSAPETWHNFDDSKVTKIREECVMTQNAYLLFYAREGTPWFSTAYEELKTLFAATPLNTSPKSVLENTCREEVVSDHRYENISSYNKDSVKVSIPNENYSDFRCHEPHEDVFHSAGSGIDDDYSEYDDFESPKGDESEKPFADTFHREEPILYPASNRATIDDDASVPEVKIQTQASSPKRKAYERTILGVANRPQLKIQKQDYFPKRQGSFQIQREHLQNKKKEETSGTKPFRSLLRPSAEDPKGEGIAHSYLYSNPTARHRQLAAALGSPIPKRKLSNMKRSTMGLHRNLSQPVSHRKLSQPEMK
ncbi:hypothetical protein AALP_AA6G111700 [Arabis alpina]|uniref:Ubiquitin carboxyl-terminal hydrolase n=1 Tax=Arabis alpina TaxID=50452 RepID=A0A087GNI4_ARAAL|nr:hypothetical protein AALP_AA6G111700 [Arabis alpina]